MKHLLTFAKPMEFQLQLVSVKQPKLKSIISSRDSSKQNM